MKRGLLLIAVCLAGCGPSWQNSEDAAYLANHPFMQGCVLQQGIDPGALEACIDGWMFKGAGAEMRCSGEAWRAVQACAIASRERDEVIAGR
jgi:hypothetical protein